jgi:aspartate ammonia-lyase
MEERTEKDSIGVKCVPKNAYYGIQTMRAVENFPISGVNVHYEIFLALAHIKKAAAKANLETNMLSSEIGNAIIQAAEEVISGHFRDQFIVDSIQGGAGTSINMNMNEVLANRALEILGKEKGTYTMCSPNSHVNMAQSTNDTVPTALKIAAYQLTQDLLKSLKNLKMELHHKAIEFDHVIKMGRTHLQDAVPIRLSQEFTAYEKVIERDIERITNSSKELLAINMGATAVGTGINAELDYIENVTFHLSKQLRLPLYTSEDLVDGTQNTDVYTSLSSNLKVSAINLSKMCNDIRLMASGPTTGLNEIHLPPRQPGSSIMPGKVNPVMAEVLNQTAFQVIGNDHTISMAAEAGQFELNVMAPIIAFNLLQSLKIMRNAIEVFTRYAVVDMKANAEQCQAYVNQSYGIITALNSYLSYEKAADLVKEALKTKKSVIDLCLEQQLFTREELNEILDPIKMTTPGIPSRLLTIH